MTMDWRKVVVGGLMGVVMVGCAPTQRSGARVENQLEGDPLPPEGRRFRGTIVSLRPPTSTILVSKDEYVGKDAFPNMIAVKYDAQTKFLLDGAETTIDKIEQYMPVTVEGRMKEGRVVATSLKFSSALPANVKRAEQAGSK